MAVIPLAGAPISFSDASLFLFGSHLSGVSERPSTLAQPGPGCHLPCERQARMKTLIADKFSEAHMDGLAQLGCEVTYRPAAKAEELPGLDVFDPEPAEGTGAFEDPILDLPNLVGTHHIGASTEQAQEAIAEEAIRIIQTFVRTGVVLNCVNLATGTPAKWQLVVRHYDRVGLLAFVMDQIRRAGINIEEVQNVIFEGAAAASCRIQLDAEPGADLLSSIKAGNPDIMGIELLRIGDGVFTP